MKPRSMPCLELALRARLGLGLGAVLGVAVSVPASAQPKAAEGASVQPKAAEGESAQPKAAEGESVQPKAAEGESAQRERTLPATAQPNGPGASQLAVGPGELRALACSGVCYLRTQIDVGVGRGMRFNNPFRLQTQLGSTAESLSLSATYLDLRAVASTGNPFGWHYGAAVSASLALQGVPQQVVTAALTTGRPLSDQLWLNGFLGCPVVLGPDLNAGVELGLEVSYWPRAGWGLYFGAVWDQFWGAATDESAAASIPIVALQAGLSLQYEVLP